MKEPAGDIQAYVRLALPLMSRHQVPITPRNYTVWYRYVSGFNRELNEVIDGMIEKGEEFSEARNAELYRRFCMETEEGELRKFQEDLRHILLAILQEITELAGRTEEYEAFVSRSVDTLSEGSSIADFKVIIGEIIDKTKTLGKLGKTVQRKLKEATEALEVLKKEFDQVKAEVSHDFLTGIANRKAFYETLTTWSEDTMFFDKGLSLLFIDIDHFKKFNDEYGHLLGDQVLKFVAQKIKNVVRGTDFVARFGGEEFAVLLPQTPIGGAQVVAESIRSLFASTPLQVKETLEKLGTITVSLGVACYRPGEPFEQFIDRADHALYFAKHTGRNRVATELDDPRYKNE